MKLILRRDQRSGMLGKVVFTLDVRAEISPTEKANIDKYKLGKELVYMKNKDTPFNDGSFSGSAKVLFFHAMNITISVNELVGGKRIECKDILEMIAAEEQVKEGAITFGRMLEAASRFGGDEIIPIGADENPVAA